MQHESTTPPQALAVTNSTTYRLDVQPVAEPDPERHRNWCGLVTYAGQTVLADAMSHVVDEVDGRKPCVLFECERATEREAYNAALAWLADWLCLTIDQLGGLR